MTIADHKSFSLSHIIFTFLLTLSVGFIVAYTTGAFKPRNQNVHLVETPEPTETPVATDVPVVTTVPPEPKRPASSIVGFGVLGMLATAWLIGAAIFVLRKRIPEGSHFHFYAMKYGVRYSVLITIVISTLAMSVQLYNEGHENAGFVMFGIFFLVAAGTFFFIYANHLTLKVFRNARETERRLTDPDVNKEGTAGNVILNILRETRLLGRRVVPLTKEQKRALKEEQKREREERRAARGPSRMTRAKKAVAGAFKKGKEEAVEVGQAVEMDADDEFDVVDAEVVKDSKGLGGKAKSAFKGLRRRARRVGQPKPKGEHVTVTKPSTTK